MWKLLIRLFSAVWLMTLIAVTPGRSAILVDDAFIDGGRTNGTDALDIAWFSQGSGSAASIATDGTTGPNEGGSDNNLLLATGGQSNRGLVGLFPSAFTLASTGYSIVLTFDLRYDVAPANNTTGFRFGLYNSNGSVITADATNTSGNDIGYSARFSTGSATTTIGLGEETGAGGSGDLPTSGGDVAVLSGGTTGTVANISGTANYYRLQLSITRNGSGLDFVVSEGVNTTSLTTAYSVSDASASTFTFDEIAIFNGAGTEAFHVDNVLITTAIPEPSTYALLAMGLLPFGFMASRKLVRQV